MLPILFSAPESSHDRPDFPFLHCKDTKVFRKGNGIKWLPKSLKTKHLGARNEQESLFRERLPTTSVHVIQFRVRHCPFRVFSSIHENCYEVTKTTRTAHYVYSLRIRGQQPASTRNGLKGIKKDTKQGWCLVNHPLSSGNFSASIEWICASILSSVSCVEPSLHIVCFVEAPVMADFPIVPQRPSCSV